VSYIASDYAARLRRCPDGAPLKMPHKCILMLLAEHHNRHSGMCNPSRDLLLEEACTSESMVKRALKYLESHGVIQVHRPAQQGRGHYLSYTFPDLDAPPLPPPKRQPQDKEGQHEPLFSREERGPKGGHPDPKGVQKGVNGAFLIRKNQEPEEPKNQGGARAGARQPLLLQSERDSLDLKRWQTEMRKTEPQPGTFIQDHDAHWRRRAREAAFDGGISPVRLVELLTQHFPADPNIPLLYPDLCGADGELAKGT
jgi:hypothetical protein